MRWGTTIWMSVALVVATSALHLTIEHDLQAEQESSSPSGFPRSTKQDKVYIPDELVFSRETKADEKSEESVEKPSQSKSNEHTASSSKSAEKSTESDEEEGDGSNGGNDNGSNGDNDNGKPEAGEPDIDEPETDGPEIEEPETEAPETEAPETEATETEATETEAPATEATETDAPETEEPETEVPETGDHTIVKTTTGTVRGHVWRDNARIISYIDIKYGTFKKPLEAPVPPDPWETIHEVKDHSKRCPQLQNDQYVGDIDCLTLSIFKPSVAAGASVLVYIHEGNFTNGSANPAIYGPEYLVSKGIILVLPNYRLGPLGFLCLQNETAPGNAALKDLALALSWIKANIAEFGGDPENIAVSGDGTAGALAGYLALSPMSKNNVNKVITDSGSVLSHWAIDRNPIVAATDLANSISGFQSWQDVETSVLVTAAKDIVLRPCLENNTDNGAHFMVETPWKMIEKQEIKTSFIIGSAKYAGAHEWLNHTTASIQQLNEDVGLLLPNDLQFETSKERSRIGNKVKTQYFDEAAINIGDVEKLTLYLTDAGYLGPGIRTSRALVGSGATVYFYEFSFVGSLNRELEAIPLPIEGAVRGDIIGYLFTQDGAMPAEDTKELRMVDQLIELWTTFLKTGTPSAENIEWDKLEKANASEEQWLSIETLPSLKTGLHGERLRLWTDIYNEYFIEKSLAFATSPGVYTVIVLQVVFFISFFKNAWHFF